MTDEPDYKKMYEDKVKEFDDMKIKYDATVEKVNSFDGIIKERDNKITELKIYISDNIVGKPNEDTKIDEPKTFDEIYKETLSEMRNKK